MAKATCVYPGCDRPVRTRGYCKRHYYELRASGELALVHPLNRPKAERCVVEGCEKPANVPGSARDMCRSHYHVWYRRGDPLAPTPKRHYPAVAERFWTKVDQCGIAPEHAPDLGPCWLWAGATTEKGYGSFWGGVDDPRTYGAHVWSWTRENGPVPHDFELDHLCRVRCCVRPAHLEAVSHAENVARGEAGKHFADRTHCPQGHPYDEENTYFNDLGYRSCRTCGRETMRRRRASPEDDVA